MFFNRYITNFLKKILLLDKIGEDCIQLHIFLVLYKNDQFYNHDHLYIQAPYSNYFCI